MQLVPFVKYQATGNDFILFNNFQEQCYVYDPCSTRRLCHRQFGIGADGIITLEKKQGYDFAFYHYNADGSPGGGLCGNGSRTALYHAQDVGIIKQEAYFFAFDGAHKGFLQQGCVSIQLQDVASIKPFQNGYLVNNGTRHYVEIVEDLDQLKMEEKGFPQRYMPPFEKKGINVNFVEFKKDKIYVRTCECGLDEEPLSCGTGSVASALVASLYYGLKSPIEVQTKGGTLWIKFNPLEQGFSSIYLMGAVVPTFYGHVARDIVQASVLP